MRTRRLGGGWIRERGLRVSEERSRRGGGVRNTDARHIIGTSRSIQSGGALGGPRPPPPDGLRSQSHCLLGGWPFQAGPFCTADWGVGGRQGCTRRLPCLDPRSPTCPQLLAPSPSGRSTMARAKGQTRPLEAPEEVAFVAHKQSRPAAQGALDARPCAGGVVMGTVPKGGGVVPPRYGIQMRVHYRYCSTQSRSAKQKSKKKAL